MIFTKMYNSWVERAFYLYGKEYGACVIIEDKTYQFWCDKNQSFDELFIDLTDKGYVSKFDRDAMYSIWIEGVMDEIERRSREKYPKADIVVKDLIDCVFLQIIK